MPITVRFLAVSVLAWLLAGLFAPVAALPAKPAPAISGCSHERWPPAPVDTSEEPPPGMPSPAPPPVPKTPAGGPRMAECGRVLPPGAKPPQVPPNLAAWLVQDLDTGEILAAKNPHARHRPASLIKTLLALTVLEELPLSNTVVATEEDANQECSCAGVVPRGRYSVGLLLDALLIRSGNDVAHTLATALGGFNVSLRKMNELATRLGAVDTQAATPSGLDGPGMTTSAYDMSLIFREAMRQPEYVAAVRTQHLDFPGGRGKPPIPIYNDNPLWDTYPGFIGGKTGFTDDARHTYAGAAERNGTRLAVVLLRAEQRPMRIAEQAKRLLDYGFALSSRGTAAVGTVTIPEPPKPATTDAVGAPAAARDIDKPATEQAQAAPQPDRFGVTGWIVTLVVTVAVGVGLIVAHRKGLIHRAE